VGELEAARVGKAINTRLQIQGCKYKTVNIRMENRGWNYRRAK
jgi:hypothetical protein